MPQYVKKLQFLNPLGPKLEPAKDSRRKYLYIDTHLQGGLIAAFLFFQVLLIVVGMLLLYNDLNQVIEDQMFRVHPGVQEGVPVFLQRILVAVPVSVLINIMLIALIEWVWSGYVAKIVWPLRYALDSVFFLDLRHRPAPTVEHEVLEKLGDWIQSERLRCAQLQQLSEELRLDMDVADARKLIAEMKERIPR